MKTGMNIRENQRELIRNSKNEKEIVYVQGNTAKRTIERKKNQAHTLKRTIACNNNHHHNFFFSRFHLNFVHFSSFFSFCTNKHQQHAFNFHSISTNGTYLMRAFHLYFIFFWIWIESVSCVTFSLFMCVGNSVNDCECFVQQHQQLWNKCEMLNARGNCTNYFFGE